MKKIIYILLFFVSTSLQAQNKVAIKIPEIDTVFNTKLTGEIFIERKQFVGNQYYNSNWSAGEITLNNGKNIQVKSLKYNGLYDELIWLNDCNLNKFKIDKPLIKDFRITNDWEQTILFKKINLSKLENDSLNDVFLEVATEGKFSFYILRKISLQWPQYFIIDNVRVKYDVLKPTPVYYLKTENETVLKLEKLQRKYLFRLFPEKKSFINQLINNHHLRLKTENDFVRLFQLLNDSNP